MTENKVYTVEQLYGMYKRGNLLLDMNSELTSLEPIFLNMPINILVKENLNSQIEVVVGHSVLASIIKCLNNEIKLTGFKIYTDLEDKFINDLDIIYTSAILDTHISATRIKYKARNNVENIKEVYNNLCKGE